MALSGKLEVDVEVKSPADKVFEFYNCTPYLMSKSSPETIQSIDLIEGQWGKDGSVLCGNFFIDGKAATNKAKVGLDYKNKLATYRTIGGTLLEMFKRFTMSLHVTPREQGSLVHWIFEYEKLNANVPDPNLMLHITVDCCKDIDACLTQEANTPRTPQLQYN